MCCSDAGRGGVFLPFIFVKKMLKNTCGINYFYYFCISNEYEQKRYIVILIRLFSICLVAVKLLTDAFVVTPNEASQSTEKGYFDLRIFYLAWLGCGV